MNYGTRDQEQKTILEGALKKKSAGAKCAFVSKCVTVTRTWKVSSPAALALLRLRSYINTQEEEIASDTAEVGTHGYTHPHSGRHPGTADRNRFRPAGTQLGSDVKAVETSALTGLIRDEADTYNAKGLGNTTERCHLARRLVQWDLLKQWLSAIKVGWWRVHDRSTRS